MGYKWNLGGIFLLYQHVCIEKLGLMVTLQLASSTSLSPEQVCPVSAHGIVALFGEPERRGTHALPLGRAAKFHQNRKMRGALGWPNEPTNGKSPLRVETIGRRTFPDVIRRGRPCHACPLPVLVNHCGSTGLTLIDDCSPGKQVVTAAGKERWRPKLRGSVFVY
jgi:hypothetical protein